MAPVPTFATNKDRLTFLLAEYKLLVSGLVLGGIGLWVYYNPQLPTPPDWVGGVLVGWMLLGVPSYLVGAKIARWLRTRNWVEVHHVNAVEDTVEKYKVPPETWEEAEIEGPDPYPVNGGRAWAVREYEYLNDIDQLRVRGVWLEGCRDTQLMTAKKQMEDIHGWLIDRAEELAAIRGRWSRGAVELQGKLINAASEAQERGQIQQKTAAKDTFEELIEDGEDPEEAPTVHDLTDADLSVPVDGETGAVGDGPQPTVEEGPTDD